MAKTRTKYVCSNCGYQSPKGFGRCPNCGEFNTMKEVVEDAPNPKAGKAPRQPAGTLRTAPQRLSEISADVGERLFVPVEEFNRVLGGGIVPGSIILLGGEPGFGKSTLLLQLSLLLKDYTVLYVSGEESEQQTKMRAERLQQLNDQCYILTETNTESIFHNI